MSRMIGRMLTYALAVLLAAFAPGAGAQSIVSTGGSLADVEILPGQLASDGTRLAGLEITLAPGWKTYWRSPGEAGVPPRFDFSGSGNLRDVEVLWPKPMLFDSFGLTTIGYGGRVVLPLRLTPIDPAEPIGLKLGLMLGVCRDICVFEETELSRNLPAQLTGGGVDIAIAAAAVPPEGRQAGLISATCRLRGAGETRGFEASLHFDAPVRDPVVIVEGSERVRFHGTRTEVGTEARVLAVTAEARLTDEDVWFSRSDVRLTVLADGMSADIHGCEASDR